MLNHHAGPDDSVNVTQSLQIPGTRLRQYQLVRQGRYMGPPPRSFATDAHDYITIPILRDRPNTGLRRDLCV